MWKFESTIDVLRDDSPSDTIFVPGESELHWYKIVVRPTGPTEGIARTITGYRKDVQLFSIGDREDMLYTFEYSEANAIAGPWY